MSTAGKTPRFPQLTPETLTDAQRPLAEQIMKISRVGIAGPYNALLRSPVMAQRMYDLLDYLRWHSSVPTRLNEFAILIQGRLWRSQVEWFAHFPLAVKAGLPEKVALDLKANKRPEGMQARRGGGLRLLHGAFDQACGLGRDLQPPAPVLQRAAGGRSHRDQRHLRDGGDGARRNRSERAAGQRSAVQAGRAVGRISGRWAA